MVPHLPPLGSGGVPPVAPLPPTFLMSEWLGDMLWLKCWAIASGVSDIGGNIGQESWVKGQFEDRFDERFGESLSERLGERLR